jgi:pyruvate kinase
MSDVFQKGSSGPPIPPSLIVTLGPSTAGKEAELAYLGATQFRINSSHVDIAGLCDTITHARERAPRIPIVVDLQGAKMRLGDFEQRPVSAGQRLSFVLTDSPAKDQIPLPHPEPFAALKTGDAISIDDGRLAGTVECVATTRIDVLLSGAGVLRPRKGFNRAIHPVALNDLSLRDREIVMTAYAQGCRAFAVSFVADGRECEWVRRQVGPVELIAKIERQDALGQMQAIAAYSDALWVCRGDLGAQLGLTALGRAVAAIDPQQFKMPVFMAGQVFEHLTKHHDTTRTEVCHLYDLMTRGYAGIVLSDETAIGHDPPNAVRIARALLDASR